jgi:ferredoxin-NADP reductase
MPRFAVRLLKKETVAEGTTAFRFERPVGFAYEPGQNMDVFLIDPPETDAEGDKRTFSLVSAPHEADLTVATRMRDTAFKRVLGRMPEGGTVEIDGPHGSMTLQKDEKRPAVFLAGGIGITPFMSMARDAAERHLPHRIFLFYSNRRPEDSAFLDELRGLERANPNFRMIATMTDMAESKQPWAGETGFIDQPMLRRHLEDLDAPIWYMAGPPAMTAAMRKLLTGAGVSPDDIRSEEFTGY